VYLHNVAALLRFANSSIETIVYFMVTPCVKWCRTLFIYQLTYTTLRSVELLKPSKMDKTLQHVSVYMETIFRELKSVLG